MISFRVNAGNPGLLGGMLHSPSFKGISFGNELFQQPRWTLAPLFLFLFPARTPEVSGSWSRAVPRRIFMDVPWSFVFYVLRSMLGRCYLGALRWRLEFLDYDFLGEGFKGRLGHWWMAGYACLTDVVYPASFLVRNFIG